MHRPTHSIFTGTTKHTPQRHIFAITNYYYVAGDEVVQMAVGLGVRENSCNRQRIYRTGAKQSVKILFESEVGLTDSKI